jgi:Flp pilus assembly protein TadD
LKVAEEYAKKAAELAADDPSAARLLAEVFRAAGRLVEAESTLLGALKLKTENDALIKGLQADLAALRRELGQSE